MKRWNFKVVFVTLFAFLCANTALAFDHQHTLFEQVLQQNVVMNGPQSSVRYGNIKSNSSDLDAYLKEVESVSQAEFDSWNEKQQIAFLINAYNALTIELILTKYPDLKSIKDLGGFFSGPWKIKFFKLFGEQQHLDHIEHGLLRVDYTEPRIHFALVCASIGCPALQPFAYQAEMLDQQLNAVMKAFLRDQERNYVDQSKKILYLSSIFKWFEEDFTKVKNSVEAFVAPWMTDDPALRDLIQNKKLKRKYLDYDWSLNKAE